MIPANTITPAPIVSDFLGWTSADYDPLSQTVYGGIALNDPSMGRMYQLWNISYIDGLINVKPVNGAVVFTLSVANVTTVGLAFDNNMSVVISYQVADTSNIYYYDTAIASFVTKTVTGTTSCQVAVDDPRQVNETNSDVIFSYTNNGSLYWSQQRDRYDIARLVGQTQKRLIKIGPNVGNRFQFGLA